MPDRRTAPQLLLPTFTLPNAVPGSPQWTNPVVNGAQGSVYARSLFLTCIAAATVSIHLVPPGGATGTGNLLVAAMPLSAGDCVDIFGEDKEKTIPAGYSLFFFASAANSVNATFWGEQV